MDALLDLILPLECGGCAAPGSRWCSRCRAALHQEPIAIRPRVQTGAPCWALGRYAGPHRRAVIEAKERGRRDLAAPLGAAIADALRWLRWAGELDPPQLAPLVLIPAPSRSRAARVRGGDPARRVADAAAAQLRGERCRSLALLTTARGVRDSVGLSAAQRTVNLSGRIRVRRPPQLCAETNIVLVDDVLTTGATAAESVRTLAGFGVRPTAILVVAAA